MAARGAGRPHTGDEGRGSVGVLWDTWREELGSAQVDLSGSTSRNHMPFWETQDTACLLISTLLGPNRLL